MAEIFDPATSQPLTVDPISDGFSLGASGFPNWIIPKPFSMNDPDFKADFEKIRGECVDKSTSWENRMTGFFGEYEEYTDSWRVQSRRPQGMPNRLFNSKSGETHRSVETLTVKEFSILTSSDPFFYAQGKGLDQNGREPSQIELQAVEQVMREQLLKIRFEEKLNRAIRSKKLFGSMIVECPWTSFPYGDGEKSFEGTDFIPRSLLLTGFNPMVFDLDASDYIFTIDFPTITMIRNWARNNKANWNLETIEKVYEENKGRSGSSTGASKTMSYNRMIQRKIRAGYNMLEVDVYELMTYHGRIDTNLDVVQKYWETVGRQDDPSLCDFTVGIMQESGVVRFHATPFKTWHHLFKTSHEKLFELEPLGYGVGKIGRKRQRELDALESRTNDLVMFNVLPMWKIGKYAGVDVSKLTIKPWSFVELENIDQLEPIKANIEAMPFSLNMQSVWKEDFRTMSGATGNLQGAGGVGKTATENMIVQNESMNQVGVLARITAQVFLKDYLETCHVNNVYLMDNGFWVKTFMVERPFYVNKDNLPANVGFMLKLATDKDGRQQTMQNILQALQMATSFRNSPTAMNVIEPLWQQLFRSLGMDARLLTAPTPMYQQMIMNMQMQQNRGNTQGLMTDANSMQSGSAAGGGSPQGGFNSPVGAVATSPNQSPVQMSHG